VAIDGEAGGVIEFADRVRPDLRPFFADLHQLGIRRTMLLTGDREATAQAVAAEAGITEVYANLLPADKVAIVASLVDDGHRVVMVGDGTNDAPALSRATVGVALAAHGGGISAEAADVVVLADDLHRVTEAIKISRRTLRIARQSINVGLGLSLVAMGFAALGAIPPIAGALLQEAIDVAVILNALRASMPAGR
jgi:P-type E1-E2 ATPase